jgi:hypothetical protein
MGYSEWHMQTASQTRAESKATGWHHSGMIRQL